MKRAIQRLPVAAAVLACCGAGAQTAALPEVRVTDTGSSPADSTGQYIVRSVGIGKTGQSLRETPQSISVVTRQQLDERNLTKLEDALKFVTGVNVTRLDGAGNYNSLQSRGFDIGAIQLDGVPISQGANYSTALDTAIYDRIEILRGPAGLLQGGGEPGGAINLVRKRALGLRALGANVSAGSFGFRRADADITGPLNAAGTLRGRLVAATDRRESHVDTLHNDKDVGYGTLELDLGPATTLSVGYARQRVRASLDQGLPSYANGQLLDVPRSTFTGLGTNKQDLNTADAFFELEHRLAGGGLVKLSARDVQRDSLYSGARANSAAAANGDYQMEFIDYLQKNKDRLYDLYFTSPVAFAGRSHRVLLGLSRNEGDNYGGNFAYGTPKTVNIFRPDYSQPYPAIKMPGFTSITTRTEEAVYGQAQIGLTEQLKVLAGGRLSWAQAQVRSTASGAVTSTSKPGRQFTPSVAALYDLNANLTAYASYAETFVLQTALDAARNLLPPRTGKQVEIGVKGEFLNKRLQTHAALFRIDDKGRAITDPVVTTASIPGGEVRSQGFELEASGQVAPGWDVLAGYAYTDTKYVKAPVAQVGQVFSPVTPKHSLNLFSRYALRGAAQGWSVGGGVSWRSEFYAQSGALRLVSGNYALVNAQVAYQINDQLSLSLNAENLLDKTYYDKVSYPGRQNFYGEPRRIVLALKARY